MSLKETFSSVLVSIFGRQLAWRSLLNSNIKLSQLRAVEEMIGHTDAKKLMLKMGLLYSSHIIIKIGMRAGGNTVGCRTMTRNSRI